MVGFALGPVLILHLVSTYGTEATVWLAIPGIILGIAVGLLLPQWDFIRRPPRRLFDMRLVCGLVGLLAFASMFSALAFVTFHRLRPTLARAGTQLRTRRGDYRLDAVRVRLRGRPRFDPGWLPRTEGRPCPHHRRGRLLLTVGPLLAVIASEPGTALYFGTIGIAGVLLFVPIPALITAQEFVPGAPATACSMVLGLGSALAGVSYVVLGRSGGGRPHDRDSDRLQHGRPLSADRFVVPSRQRPDTGGGLK